jgi:diadenylate cyclase
MKLRAEQQFRLLFDAACGLCEAVEAEALLVLTERDLDWSHHDSNGESNDAKGCRVIVASERESELEGARQAGLTTILLDMGQEVPVVERLSQALLDAVASEYVQPGGRVVSIYAGFDADTVDSISCIHLDEHLGRLTATDLRNLQTSVPLETLKTVVDLAVEIGREGREGKAVGTMFVVGDTRRVLSQCHPAGYDSVRGYGRKDRNLFDPRVREGIKEVALMDGAFIVSSDGTVERACQLVDASPTGISLAKGLGARHWAGAAITKNSKAIAVVVSQSTGTVRIFQDGEVVLRVEPLRRAMKWRDFEYEPPVFRGSEDADD